MTIIEFFDRVESHPDLEGVGLVPGLDGGDPAVVVRHRPTGLLTRIGLPAIFKCGWPDLEAILTGMREPAVLKHMSRVVGYFSRTENWNKSKIGELHDRHRGNYAIPAAD